MSAVSRQPLPFSEELKRGRSLKDLTQEELAKLCGVSVTTISNWERGTRHPKNKLGLVRHVLGLDEPGPNDDARPIRNFTDAEMLADLARRIAELHDALATATAGIEQARAMAPGSAPADLTDPNRRGHDAR